MMDTSKTRMFCVGALLALTMGVQQAYAVPFTVTGQLTGDFRPANPDNLFVDVTVQGDTTSGVTHWTVDMNSPLHPNAFSRNFFFNLDLGGGVTVSFSNISLAGWGVTSGDNAPGSGSADFMLGVAKPGAPNPVITNAVNLTFDLTLSSGNWTQLMLLNAPLSTGGGIPDPGAQMGMHLQSLSTAGCTSCTSDSGFASGNFDRPVDPPQVPEPTTLLLLGSGLLGSTLFRRKRARD